MKLINSHTRFLLVALTALTLSAAVHSQTRRTTTQQRGTQSKSSEVQTKPATRTPAATKSAAPKSAPAAPQSPAPQTTPPVAVPFDECGCEPWGVPDVLASVSGVSITQKDLSSQAQQRIDTIKKEIIEARERELELQINSHLLEAEAKKRGLTTAKLLDAEVIAKVKEPTEAEAQSFFEQNKARIEAQSGRAVEFREVRNYIISYLRDQRQQDAAKAFADRLRAAAAVKLNVQKATAPASAADRARVFATVNGRPVTSADIEDSLKPLIASAQDEIYTLRKQEVDTKINDILLQEEARKRGTTARALLDAEVNSKLSVVTEADALKFFNENKERINGDFAQLKYQIIQYLEEQAKHKANAAFAQRLRNAASVQTFIRRPEPPVYNISTDDQPSKGSPNAPITIVEFTDYQCPSCAQTHPVLQRLTAEYGDRLRLVVRDFPLAQHENAFKAAEAAEAAREQGKYWEYVELLFRNQSSLGVANLKQFATAVGLDRARFDAALDSGKFADSVQRDIADGQKVGVSGTPSLFVNGRPINDRSYEGLKLVIEDALKSAPKKQ